MITVCIWYNNQLISNINGSEDETNLASDLVRPTSVVSQTSDAVTNIEVAAPDTKYPELAYTVRIIGLPSNSNGLAVVQTLEFCEDVSVALHEVRETVDEARPFSWADILAPSRVERRPGSGNSTIDISSGT